MSCSSIWLGRLKAKVSSTISSLSTVNSVRAMSGTRRPISAKPKSFWVTSRCTISCRVWKLRCLGIPSSFVDLKTFSQRLAGIHSDHRRIARGAARVAFFLLLGKAAGALKEMAVAYRYGVSDEVDAYQFTMTMANWLPVTAVGALSVVLIPVLVRVNRDGATERRQFLGELHGMALLAAVALALLTFFAWPLVLRTLGQGLSPAVQDMTRQLVWGFAPVAALTLLAGVWAARLRARERHVNTLLDSVPAVSLLAWVMLAGASPGVAPLLWGTLAGFAIQAAWLAWLAARADGMWVRPSWGMH